MLLYKCVMQPSNGEKYLSLIEAALENGEFTHFDVAVAYATASGVNILGSLPAQWRDTNKRWIVGIDWCRTDPIALERLKSMHKSKVRVHDGLAVANRPGCVPTLPFHPKTFLLRGVDVTAVITGSGNLSLNGLNKGHELGTLLMAKKPLANWERPFWDSCESVTKWFNKSWRAADELSGVLDLYKERYQRKANLSSPVPVDDDATPLPRRRALSPEQLRKLRACRHLWIEAGNLHKNRGPGKPGNQLMLSPMTRVFFGFPAEDLERDTSIGDVRMLYGTYERLDCSLRYSNNSMDVLTLPVPGTEGPPTYDQKTLMFEKSADRRGVRFVLTVGTRAAIREWRRRSQDIFADYEMTSGRRWGVF